MLLRMFFIVIFLCERIITQKCNLRLLFGDAFAFREFLAAFVENFVEACSSENQISQRHACMIPLGNRTGIYYVDFFLPGEKAKEFL